MQCAVVGLRGCAGCCVLSLFLRLHGDILRLPKEERFVIIGNLDLDLPKNEKLGFWNLFVVTGNFQPHHTVK